MNKNGAYFHQVSAEADCTYVYFRRRQLHCLRFPGLGQAVVLARDSEAI